MDNNIKMEAKSGMELLWTTLAACAVMLIEQFLEHPISGITTVILLLFTFERWRTQRIEYKLKKKQLEEYERPGTTYSKEH